MTSATAGEVLFLHGMGDGPQLWDEQRDLLPPGWRSSAPDLMAGPRKDGVPLRLEREVDDVVAALGESGAPPVHLCGHSMGAMIALAAALRAPEWVAGLVLCGGQVRPPPALMAVQTWLLRVLPTSTIAPGGWSRREVLDAHRQVTAFDARGRLGRIAAPALVICGSADRANRPAASALAAGIPGARLQIVRGAGHRVPVDRPRVFARALHEHLAAASG